MSVEKDNRGQASFKRKRNDGGAKKTKGKRTKTNEHGVVMDIDQLPWKKISMENDEFEDFEEVEGVDVEYIDKDGSKHVYLKVYRILIRLIVGSGQSTQKDQLSQAF